MLLAQIARQASSSTRSCSTDWASPPPAQEVLHGQVGERLRGSLQRRNGGGVPVGGQQGEAVEQQVEGARAPGRGGSAGRRGRSRRRRPLQRRARRGPPLPRRPGRSRARAPGRTARAAWPRSAAAEAASLPRPDAKATLAAHQIHAGALEPVERSGFGRGRQLERCRRTRRPGSSPAPRSASAPRAAPDRRELGGSLRNAAAAATPPRACARPAERSSSAATSSSGPGVARARCQARRSGSVSATVARPAHGARGAVVGGGRAIGGGPDERVRELDAPAQLEQPAVLRRARRREVDPERPAARCSSTGSPRGSAAAVRTSSRVSDGSSWRRRT